MQANSEIRYARVKNWLDQVRPLADATHPLGREALARLPQSTGLSVANVAWALTHAFEVDASPAEISSLVASVDPAPAAHVLLSANVFVGALRAIALGLASSSRVCVRPSTREPSTAALLQRAAPDAFELGSDIRPAPGDHVWAYGADTTIEQLRTQLPRGVTLHGHGDGHGVILIDDPPALTERDYDAMALDIAAFDQRGCLSPRLVLLKADPPGARAFCEQLLLALDRMEQRIPLGSIDTANETFIARHLELWRYLGEVFEGPGGRVTLDGDGLRTGDLPAFRTIHVRVTDDPIADLVGLSDRITAWSSRVDAHLVTTIATRFPQMRWSPLGMMQRPRLDGPVDRRADRNGILL